MLSYLAGALLDLLLPPSCSICNELLDDSKSTVCAECRFSFYEITPPVCSICGQALQIGDESICPTCRLHRPMVEKIRSAFLFGGAMQQAVVSMKLSRRSELAQYLAKQAFEVPLYDWKWSEEQVLVPVPLHRKRLHERMFDQASLIAIELGRLSGVPVSHALLDRTTNTRAQARQTDRETRMKNIKGAFKACSPKLVEKRSICLIDDVVTTGATLDECAKVLYEAGAGKVTAFTIARTPIGNL